MTSSVLRDGFSIDHSMTRQRVESSIDLRRLFAAIDADPAIVGAGVVYLDTQMRVVVLREFQPICSIAPMPSKERLILISKFSARRGEK